MSEVDPFEEYDDDNDVDLDPQNKAPSRRLERFKGEQGKTYRIALLYFHPLEVSLYKAAKKKAAKEKKSIDKEEVKKLVQAALAKRAETYSKSIDELEPWEKLDTRKVQFKKTTSQFGKQQGVGLVISRLGKDGEEADRYWKMLEDPQDHYWSIILLYPIDREGNVDQTNILRDGYVKPLRIGPSMFNTLVDKDQMIKGMTEGKGSLATYDLTLKCKNAQYQNFDVDPAGPAIWTKSDKVKAKFLPLAVKMYEKLTAEVREISTADLKEKLGYSGGSDSGEDVEDDMDSMIDNV